MQTYRFTFNVEDNIEAESEVEAWEIVKARMDDRFYGPTRANLELTGETVEEVKPEES